MNFPNTNYSNYHETRQVSPIRQQGHNVSRYFQYFQIINYLEVRYTTTSRNLKILFLRPAKDCVITIIHISDDIR